MSLDANLFTLFLTPAKDDPSRVELIDQHGTVHYQKKRGTTSANGTYSMSIYDPLADSLLATVSGIDPTSKQKTIELYNPSVVISFTYTGTLIFKWSFEWEGQSLEWRRDACYLIRKPDPPVIVCTCDSPSNTKRSALQILDYNLQRFDIEDRKGLEIAIIAGLLSFYDQSEEYHHRAIEARAPAKPALPKISPTPSTKSSPQPDEHPKSKDAPLPIPVEGNEIYIQEEGTVDDYVRASVQLLKDDNILYVVLRASTASNVQKCIAVAEATKRYMYKTSNEDDEELHQYVAFDEPDKGKGKGRQRINLDGPAKDPKHDYRPPESLTIHLSKIAMPELQPKPTPRPSPAASDSLRPRAASSPPVRSPSPADPSPTPLQDTKPRKGDKGKRRADPSPEPVPAPDKGKGKASDSLSAAPEPRPDKGKARADRPLSAFFPPSEPHPEKGKGRQADPPRPASTHGVPAAVKPTTHPTQPAPQLKAEKGRSEKDRRPSPAPVPASHRRAESHSPRPPPLQQQQQGPFHPPSGPPPPKGQRLSPGTPPYGSYPGQYPAQPPPHQGQPMYGPYGRPYPPAPYPPPTGPPPQQQPPHKPGMFERMFGPSS